MHSSRSPSADIVNLVNSINGSSVTPAFLNIITTGSSRFMLVSLLGLLLAASGCRDPKVESYRVAKEADTAPPSEPANAGAAPHGAMPESAQPSGALPAAMPGMGAMASTPVETAAGANLTWTAPGDWQAKDLGQMRKGSFTVTGADGAIADLSITAFPGAVGGELANINRWRGQVSLDPIDAAGLPAAATRVTAGDLTFTVVDLAGSGDQPKRILGAMVPFGQAMWFFKLMGPDALVTAAKPAFLAFLQTVKAPAPAAP